MTSRGMRSGLDCQMTPRVVLWSLGTLGWPLAMVCGGEAVQCAERSRVVGLASRVAILALSGRRQPCSRPRIGGETPWAKQGHCNAALPIPWRTLPHAASNLGGGKEKQAKKKTNNGIAFSKFGFVRCIATGQQLVSSGRLTFLCRLATV